MRYQAALRSVASARLTRLAETLQVCRRRRGFLPAWNCDNAGRIVQPVPALINADIVNPNGIVWLASYPKSGNTWVRAFLFALQKLRAGEQLDAINLDEMVYWGETDRDLDYFKPHLSGPAASVDKRE